MPANYIVINSKFKPFSYAEMLQPVQRSTAAHQEIENQYADLATKASIWDEMANEQTDPYAYKMYKTYSNDLEESANQLATEGLTTASRQNMLKMRQRYSSEIIPIEQAYARRKELIDEQRKMLAKDSTYLFDRDASSLSLDDLIRNPELTYQSRAGSELLKQANIAGQSLAKEMRSDPRKWDKVMNGQYWQSLTQQGYRPEEIILAAASDPKAPEELKKVIKDVIESSGIQQWDNQDALNRAYYYAGQGLWGAIGSSQYQVQPNKDYLTAAQRAKSGASGGDPRLPYERVPRTSVNPDVKTTALQADADFIRGLMADSSILNKQATREVGPTKTFSPDPQASFVMTAPVGGGRMETYYPYRDKLKKITEKYGTKNPQEIIDKINKEIASSAVRDFQYRTNYTDNSSMNKTIQENLIAMSRDSEEAPAYEYSRGRKGDRLDLEDLESITDKDAFISYDANVGVIYNYKDKKGKIKSAVLSTEVLDDSNRTLSRVQKDIDRAMGNGDYTLASKLIDHYMRILDGRFNTKAKIQSNTDSKLSVPYPTINFEEEEE